MKDLIQQLKDRIPFQTVCNAHGIKFNRSNKALCPYHDDKRPSFHNYGTHGYCFSCNKHADIFDIEGKFTDESNIAKIAESLVKKYGVKVGDITKAPDKDLIRKQEALRLLEEFTAHANKNINNNPNVKKFLKAKAIDYRDVERFQIGYMGNENSFYNLIKDDPDKVKLALEIGLLKKDKVKYKDIYLDKECDYFRNRIIYPLLNYGKPEYITGRAYPNIGSKYKHLKRLKHLYKPLAFKENLNKEYCVFVEGITDAIALIKCGIPAVALVGTNIGQDKCLLNSDTKYYFCLDNDEAGNNAAYKLAKEYKGYILNLGHKEDPDEVLNKLGKEKFKKLVNESISKSKYYLDAVIEKEPIEESIKEVSLIKNKKVRESYAQKIQSKRKIGIKKIRSMLESFAPPESIQPEVQTISDKKKRSKYLARFESLIDIVEYENETHFLVIEDGIPVLKQEVTIDNELFIPPPKNKWPKRLLLPRFEKVKGHFENDNENKLFEDIENYLRSISELPDDRLYSLIAAWIFHTYLMEKWSHSPYLCFYAVPERGKSRTGKAITYASYRGRHTETLREANIFRASETLGATLFFDCMDIWKKALKQKSEDILLLRFEKGAQVERILYPEKGPFDDTVYYDIFGATIIATNEPVHNILDTRCIPIIMQQSSKVFELDPSEQLGLEFRERLTAWRAIYLNKELPTQSKPAKGRLGDILKPLAIIINLIIPERRSELDELVRSIEKSRMVEKSISIEGEVLYAISKSIKLVENKRLTISDITYELNREKDNKEEVAPQKVGKVLTSLGFERAKKHGGKRCIIYDESKLNELLQSYGIEEASPMSPDDENDSQPTGIFGKNQGDINGDSKINNDTQDVTSTSNGNHCINQDNKNDGDNGDISTKQTSEGKKKIKRISIKEDYKKYIKAKNELTKNKSIKKYL